MFAVGREGEVGKQSAITFGEGGGVAWRGVGGEGSVAGADLLLLQILFKGLALGALVVYQRLHGLRALG